MAFIDEESDPKFKGTFYNVFASVGLGCKNYDEDVKVVQFFLKRIYSNTRLKKETKPWGEMVIDGKCGPITRAWITRFQVDMCRLGGYCMADGIVDKAGNNIPGADNYTTSMSRSTYTIRYLNNVMQMDDREVYKNLTTHPEVPAEMKLIFLQIQAEGPAMRYVLN